MTKATSTNLGQIQTAVRPHRFSQVARSLVIGAAAALLIGRLFGSYTPFWALGVASVFWIALKGNHTERCTLLLMFFLAIWPAGQQMTLGLRACVFLSMFMVCARYCQLNIYIHIFLQAAMMVATIHVGVQDLASFAFGPSVLLLMITTRYAQVSTTRAKGSVLILSILSLLTATIGFGSRSALFVWSLSMLRRHRSFFFVLCLLIIPTAIVFSEIPVLSKLNNSLTEVFSPLEESGAVNFRAVESLVFVDYITSASSFNILFGSSHSIFLPGELVGNPDDPIYLPHNQLLGIFFQFGLIGFATLCWYARSLFKYFQSHRDAAFFFLVLLPPFMLFKHGFLDSDFGLLMASLNWIRLQKGRIK